MCVLTKLTGVKNVAGDANGGKKSMNSVVSSKTEVFEMIEESPRQCKGVEDPNVTEVMELCILSKELNACVTTATLNPSRFVSHATR